MDRDESFREITWSRRYGPYELCEGFPIVGAMFKDIKTGEWKWIESNTYSVNLQKNVQK